VHAGCSIISDRICIASTVFFELAWEGYTTAVTILFPKTTIYIIKTQVPTFTKPQAHTACPCTQVTSMQMNLCTWTVCGLLQNISSQIHNVKHLNPKNGIDIFELKFHGGKLTVCMICGLLLCK